MAMPNAEWNAERSRYDMLYRYRRGRKRVPAKISLLPAKFRLIRKWREEM
jgi:hypothetical protein